MLKSLSICLAVAGLICAGPRSTIALDAPANRFSALQDWQSQIGSDLEHNKRYLPATRTRGKIGIVKFELTMNRGGWVLPGTRIVTADPDLGRVALLLLQQAQPFPAPAPTDPSALSCRSGSTISPHKDRPRSSRAANSWSVTRPIVRSSNIRLARRRFGGWRLRRRCLACPTAVPRRSVTSQSASRPLPRRPNSSSRPLVSFAAVASSRRR